MATKAITFEELDELCERVKYYRGEVLEASIFLEMVIDAFICEHLSDDQLKRNEIFNLVLNRLSYESKRSAFEAILKSTNSDLVYKLKFRKLIDEIRKVIVQRNFFAHYADSLSCEDLYENKGCFGLIEFRNSPKTEWYSQERYKKLLDSINRCTDEVKNMLKDTRPTL